MDCADCCAASRAARAALATGRILEAAVPEVRCNASSCSLSCRTAASAVPAALAMFLDAWTKLETSAVILALASNPAAIHFLRSKNSRRLGSGLPSHTLCGIT